MLIFLRSGRLLRSGPNVPPLLRFVTSLLVVLAGLSERWKQPLIVSVLLRMAKSRTVSLRRIYSPVAIPVDLDAREVFLVLRVIGSS